MEMSTLRGQETTKAMLCFLFFLPPQASSGSHKRKGAAHKGKEKRTPKSNGVSASEEKAPKRKEEGSEEEARI